MKIESRCIHGGYTPSQGEPQVLPLAQSTTYRYFDPSFVAGLFDLEQEGHMYSRISNPTVEALEKKINTLEGGAGALCTSSGQAATTLAMLNLCGPGDSILACSSMYGGTITLLGSTFRQFGISVRFVDPEAPEEEILAAAPESVRCVFGETLGNPGMNLLDFEKFARIAQALKVPFVVDNTMATPYLCRPFELGAHIVLHSATKFMDGHATSLGGCVVDGGSFPWNNGKFPKLVDPDPSYHGLSYWKNFGNKAFITKARTHLLRDLGVCLSPFNAFMIHHSLETLHVRMDRHCENALRAAAFLEGHPKISWVRYPGLKSAPDYSRAARFLPRGAGGVLSFGIQGGRAAAEAFTGKLRLASLVIHVGDLRTSVLHPASTTHRQLSEEQLKAGGIGPEMIRLSVGLENIDDILEDLDQALSSHEER